MSLFSFLLSILKVLDRMVNMFFIDTSQKSF